MTRGSWSRQNGMPWPKGGPWKISPFCPAPQHNSQNAARGRGPQFRAGAGELVGEAREKFPRCICPRAVYLLSRDQELRRARPRRAMPEGPKERGRAGAWVPNGVKAPDLSRGMCQTLAGRAAHDRAITGGSTNLAKDVCNRCVVEQECAEYVLKADPDGHWTGVFGGMSQRERREIALRRR